MKKQKMPTGIFLIPTLHISPSRDANEAIDAIIFQLGALNCEKDDDAAVIKYNGLLSAETKEILNKEIKCHGHLIMYLEAEYETPFANDDTFHIPTNEEMVEHLNAQNYGKVGKVSEV